MAGWYSQFLSAIQVKVKEEEGWSWASEETTLCGYADDNDKPVSK